MRGTAAAAGLVLLLGGCGDGSEEPEALEPGPLRLAMLDDGCTSLRGGASATVRLTLDNTGEVPLTIDEVALVDAENAVLRAATSLDTKAVDVTIAEPGGGISQRPLVLDLRMPDPESPMLVGKVSVDYHNVDGRFRASASTSADVTSEACPPSAP